MLIDLSNTDACPLSAMEQEKDQFPFAQLILQLRFPEKAQII